MISGFTAAPSPSSIGVRTYRVPGTGTLLPVRSEIAPLLIGAATEFHRTVEPLVTGWCWGFAYRAIIGSFVPSKHSAGIAIDLNAPRHPLGRRGTFTSAQATRCRAIARKYGLRWGGDWTRADEMHFELNVHRTTALQLVRALQTPPTPPPASLPPGTVPGHVHTMSVVSERSGTRHDIRDVQGHLNYWRTVRGLSKDFPDGIYRASTKYCIEVFQQANGLVRDGIVGPVTWKRLHEQTGGRRLESDGRGF